MVCLSYCLSLFGWLKPEQTTVEKKNPVGEGRGELCWWSCVGGGVTSPASVEHTFENPVTRAVYVMKCENWT